MKRTKRIVLITATLLITVLTLASCNVYGFVAGTALPDRMKAATLAGESERYYAASCRIDTATTLEYSGRFDGQNVSCSTTLEQSTSYSEADGGMKYYTTSIQTPVINGALGGVYKSELGYVDGYLYSYADNSNAVSRFKTAMSEAEFNVFAVNISDSSPYFESNRITEDVSIVENRESGLITVTYSGYADRDGGETREWLADYTGYSGMDCFINALTVTINYDYEKHFMTSYDVYIEYDLTAGEYDLDCTLTVKNTYGEPGGRDFNIGDEARYREVEDLEYLFYAGDSVRALAYAQSGHFNTTSAERDLTANMPVHDYEGDIYFTRNKDGKTYHYIQTSYADVDGSYEMECIYSNGVEKVILIEEGVRTDETEEITEYQARESVKAVLDQYVYDIADVKSVTVSEDDDGYTVLELKYNNVTGRYVLDGLTLVSCELTATYQGSYRGERHNYKINVTLENMGAE